jgi:hypothetical protein
MSSQKRRNEEIKPILVKLTELKLNVTSHPELKTLLTYLQTYVANGQKQKIHIPFPAYNCDIDGMLAEGKVWVKFTAKKE